MSAHRERRRVWNYGTADRDAWCMACGTRIKGPARNEPGAARGVCAACCPYPRAWAALRVAAEYRRDAQAAGAHPEWRAESIRQARGWLDVARDEREGASHG